MAKKGIYAMYETNEVQEKYYIESWYRESYSADIDLEKDQRSYYRQSVFNELRGYWTISGRIIYSFSGLSTGSTVYANGTYSTSDPVNASTDNMLRYVFNSAPTWGEVRANTERSRGRNTMSTRHVYSRGTYLTDTIADYGSLPADGRHTDGYWYVFLKMASDVKANIGGAWRDVPTAFVNVGGIWKPQSELKTNVNGIYR